MTTRCTWNNSTVSRVDFGQNFNGQQEATIFAAPNAEPGSLAKLPAALSSLGMQVYFDYADGQNVLKVIGHPDSNEVIKGLRRVNAISGDGTHQKVKEEGNRSVVRVIRENGTNIAGALGMAGHAALIASGYIAHEKERVHAGLQYGASAGILAIWGAGSDKPFQKLCSQLYDHLQNEGVTFTQTGSTSPMSAYFHRGLGERAYDTFKSNSILASNLIGVGGNISMLKSGIDVAKRDGIMMGIGRGAHGAVNLAGAAVASFVEEKDEEHLQRQQEKLARDERAGTTGLFSLPHKVADWISRHPLGFQGGIFLADNASAFGDVAAIRKRYIQRQNTEHVELPQEPVNPFEATNPLKGLTEGTPEYETAHASKAYKNWEKDSKGWKKSKEYTSWKKENDTLMHTVVGHAQKLEINAKKIEAEITKIPGMAEKLGQIDLTRLDSIPSAETCLQHVKALDKAIESSGKNSEALGNLLKDRRILMQELEEVEKYPKGWMLALAKACLWTASSTFQAFATKNRQVSLEQKYGELYAYVATMALDVPPGERATMVHKSAEFLASHDNVYIKAEDIEKGIHQKLDALVGSPWITVDRSIAKAQEDKAELAKEATTPPVPQESKPEAKAEHEPQAHHEELPKHKPHEAKAHHKPAHGHEPVSHVQPHSAVSEGVISDMMPHKEKPKPTDKGKGAPSAEWAAKTMDDAATHHQHLGV